MFFNVHICYNFRCKMLVAIDGFNAFFNEKTDLKTEDRVQVAPQQVTLVQTGLSAVLSDWVVLLNEL